MNRRLILTAIVLIAVIRNLSAQDGHYWTQQYGTKSMLLSGSVIGGVEDLGAVYYNPARLAVIKNPAFLLSASVYEYTNLSISDAVGSSKDVAKAEVRGVPSLAAGTFKLKFLPNHFFAYAIMTRQLSDLSTSYRNEVTTDVFTTLPGNETFSGELAFTYKANEQWIGLTWSHPISKKISIGVTTNLVTNNQTKGSKIALRALSAANEVAQYEYNRSYSYQQTGLLWKLGLSGSFGKWNLGITAKTPTLSISGDGSYNFEEYYSNIPGIGPAEIYATSFQEGLPLTLKDPLAVGFGASRSIGKSKLHFSTEWYGGISKYSAMTATDHASQSNPLDSRGFVLTDQSKSVWNAGLGIEFYISEHISGFGSFSTDYTAVTTEDITRFVQRQDETSNKSWTADFYHFGGGIVIDVKGADITLGVTHTGAKQTVPRLVSFPDGSGGSIFDPTQTSDLQWDRYRLVFSFSLPFLAKYAEKLEGK